MFPESSAYQELSDQQFASLNSLCDQFDEQLQQGADPALENFLTKVSEADRGVAFAELLAIEIDFRSTNGEQPAPEDYESRFAKDHDTIVRVFRDVQTSAERPDAASPRIPSEIGEFRIIRELGRGGMGIVYEAHQESLDRAVALKVLSGNALPDGQQRERFEREAQAAGSLHHSNIVPVFGVGRVDEINYLVMQLIDGMSLESVICELTRLRENPTGKGIQSVSIETVMSAWQAGSKSAIDPGVATRTNGDACTVMGKETQADRIANSTNQKKSLAPSSVQTTSTTPVTAAHWRTAAELMRQAADALHYAHGQGVLHRDIKPGNLLLDHAGRLWITDFGLAKSESSQDLTQTGTLLGTFRFIPPEAFHGQSSHLCDVYALGMSLYELVALRPAFDGTDQKQLIHQILHTSPQPLDAKLPRDLRTIIQKATESDPQNRYSSAADLAEDLRRFCADEPILARRVSAVERSSRWARRNKMTALLLCTLAVVLLTATTVLSVYANRVTGLNDRLSKNAVQLTSAKNLADIRANEKDQLARKAQSAVVRMKIASAYSHVKDGKIHRALISMQSAWNNDTYQSRTERTHQMRVGALLDKHPELVGLTMSTGNKGKPQYQAWNDLLMVSGDGVAEIWKPSTAELLWCIQHDSEPESEMSPDGTLLITRRGNDGLIWNIRNGSLIHTLTHETAVSHARFSPDGSFIATASEDQIIRLWNTADGAQSETTIECDDNAPLFLDFVDNDRVIASNARHQVRLWSTRTGEPLTPPLRHRPVRPRPPTFTTVDERIATVDGKSWFLWDLNDGSPLANYEITRDIESVQFCEHGGDVLVNAPYTPVTWHYDFVKSLQEPIVKKLVNPRQSHRAVISSGGDLAATTSSGGTTLVWNLRTQKIIAELANVDLLKFVDYRRLMVTNDNVTRIVSLRHRHPASVTERVDDTFRKSRTWQTGESWTLSDVASGSQFRYAKRTGQLLGPDGTLLCELESPTGRFSACFNTDGTHLLTQDNRVYSVWDAATGEQIGQSFRKPDQASLHPGADGIRIVLTFKDGSGAVWDMKSGRYLLDGRPETKSQKCEWLTDIDLFAMAPNGKYIVVCQLDSHPYHVIDVDTGDKRFQIDRHHGAPAPIQFASDSTRFITANSDTTARIWDAESGEQVGPHLPHPTYARAATISNDGSYAVTRDSDGDVRTWDVRTGELLGLPIATADSNRYGFSFSDDLNRLILNDEDGIVLEHRLARVRLSCETSRRLVELVTNLYEPDSGRSETMTDQLMQNRDQYVSAWQQWRKSLQSPSDDVETVPTANLLARLATELDRHSASGVWTCDGETLSSDEGHFSRIELPVEPTGSYQISMDFTRRSGSDHVGIQLPFCNGRSLLVVDSYPREGLVALEGIDGRLRHSSGRVHGELARIGQQRLLEVAVRQSGPYVDITATLDETEIYQWSGLSRRLILQSRVDVPHHRRPAIQTHGSRFEIRNVRVTKLL